MNYDIFNGDADGIIALLQLRLTNPIESIKISGVKRDIQLFKKIIPRTGDSLCILDISMEKNKTELVAALDIGADVFYVDHHRSGDIPKYNNLEAHINLDANTCTSLIISELLGKKYHLWAITAAYGDNLVSVADKEAFNLGLNDKQKSQLKALGTYINYNGYGAEVSDLHFDPVDLFEQLFQCTSPFDVINQPDSVFYRLEAAYKVDMENAHSAEILLDTSTVKVVLLKDATWARRVSGVYGNE